MEGSKNSTKALESNFNQNGHWGTPGPGRSRGEPDRREEELSTPPRKLGSEGTTTSSSKKNGVSTTSRGAKSARPIYGGKGRETPSKRSKNTRTAKKTPRRSNNKIEASGSSTKTSGKRTNSAPAYSPSARFTTPPRRNRGRGTEDCIVVDTTPLRDSKSPQATHHTRRRSNKRGLGPQSHRTSGSADQENSPKMGPIRDNPGKRKATEEPNTPSESKRIKSSNSDSPEPSAKILKVPAIPFPEKPAVVEERNGEIEFRVVNNDNQRESLIILTGLKCIFQKQLPKMPKDYIARLVYDRTHLSIAIVKHPLEVVGGITYRPFKDRKFAEIVFCAISSDQQVKGYGAHLMSHLKDYVKATSPVMHFLTYADNYAIGYFKKQGFTKEITLPKPLWMGYIKDYEGGTIMQCSMLPRVRYLEQGRMLLKQKEAVHAKIRAFSKSHVIHQPPKEWKNGVCKIDPMSIDAIRESGWSADMDELARQPRHGPNFNQLLHLLNDLQNHNSAWPFLNPVNKDDVADYYDVIKEPMDLATMETKLEQDNYATPEDFIADAKKIFDNCRKYNNETTPYAKSANKLEKFMWQQIKAVPEWSHLEP